MRKYVRPDLVSRPDFVSIMVPGYLNRKAEGTVHVSHGRDERGNKASGMLVPPTPWLLATECDSAFLPIGKSIKIMLIHAIIAIYHPDHCSGSLMLL